MSKRLWYGLFVVFSFLLGYFVSNMVSRLTYPNGASAFVKACGELNGLEAAVDNLVKLQGKCYVKTQTGVGADVCTEGQLLEYLAQNDTFVIMEPNRGDVDGNWRCTIQVVDSELRAVASYLED